MDGKSDFYLQIDYLCSALTWPSRLTGRYVCQDPVTQSLPTKEPSVGLSKWVPLSFWLAAVAGVQRAKSRVMPVFPWRSLPPSAFHDAGRKRRIKCPQEIAEGNVRCSLHNRHPPFGERILTSVRLRILAVVLWENKWTQFPSFGTGWGGGGREGRGGGAEALLWRTSTHEKNLPFSPRS